jgi:hypothetical protein
VLQVNTHLLKTQRYDSARIVQAIDLVRQFSEPGTLRGELDNGTTNVGRFVLIVEDNHPEQSVYINLADIVEGVANTFRVRTGGYGIFYVDRGEGGYRVRIGTEKALVMDSQRLSDGEIIALTIVRPGEYACTDTGSGAETTIAVTPIDAESFMRTHKEGAVDVRIVEKAFQPSPITTKATQPILFHAARATRIVVTESGKAQAERKSRRKN